MKSLRVVIQNDLSDILASRSFIVVGSIILVIVIAAAVAIPIGLGGLLSGTSSYEDIRPLLELFMGLIANYIPLIVLFSSMATWATEPLAKEKARGNIESLLATPLSARGVWMGKTLAIFIPAYVMGFVSTWIVILSVNLAAILPATGHFVFPVPEALTSFIFLPLLMFALIALGIIFSLITNPVIGQTIIIFTGVLLLQVVAQVGARIIWLLPSWDYALYNLAGAGLLGIIAAYFSRYLEKERIILSSKGRWA